MIVTIDGPAGAGKSHVARRLAERLGFQFLDTGAMYRAVAWAALRRGVPLDDPQAVAQLAAALKIELDGARVLVDGQDITDQIRSSEVTQATRFVADNEAVRRMLVELQRRLAAGRDVVTEGRDQGTLAFPDAECKIFLTASPLERARRRWRDLVARGETVTLEQVLQEQNQRDQRDANRPFGRLVAADDAVHVNTDGMTIDEVVQRLVEIVEAKRRSDGGAADVARS